jgi:hypothetical protein
MDKIKEHNIRISYVELLKDVKAFPNFSLAKKRAVQMIREYLKYVRDTYGQEMVDKVCGNKTKKVKI